VRVRVESGGHSIEIEHSDPDLSAQQTVRLAREALADLQGPRQGMGFGSQLVERIHDRPVPGGHGQPRPVTA
jgi:uncharacterized membrane protein affecting hemolysin expression